MARWSKRFSFSIGQPNEKGEYYIYRHDKKTTKMIAYKMNIETNEITKIEETTIPQTGFNEFKEFQEKIENRKFKYDWNGIKAEEKKK